MEYMEKMVDSEELRGPCCSSAESIVTSKANEGGGEERSEADDTGEASLDIDVDRRGDVCKDGVSGEEEERMRAGGSIQRRVSRKRKAKGV